MEITEEMIGHLVGEENVEGFVPDQVEAAHNMFQQMDFSNKDDKEGTFEVSLFAELFHQISKSESEDKNEVKEEDKPTEEKREASVEITEEVIGHIGAENVEEFVEGAHNMVQQMQMGWFNHHPGYDYEPIPSAVYYDTASVGYHEIAAVGLYYETPPACLYYETSAGMYYQVPTEYQPEAELDLLTGYSGYSYQQETADLESSPASIYMFEDLAFQLV